MTNENQELDGLVRFLTNAELALCEIPRHRYAIPLIICF